MRTLVRILYIFVGIVVAIAAAQIASWLTILIALLLFPLSNYLEYWIVKTKTIGQLTITETTISFFDESLSLTDLTQIKISDHYSVDPMLSNAPFIDHRNELDELSLVTKDRKISLIVSRHDKSNTILGDRFKHFRMR